MSRPLAPCPGCARHVFADACDCPFCGVKLSPERCAKAHPLPAGFRRMSRAARVAAGAALLSAGACGASYGSSPRQDADSDAAMQGSGGAPADAAARGSGGVTAYGGSFGTGGTGAARGATDGSAVPDASKPEGG